MMTADRLSQYDVEWTTPSENASGSMPIGNGDVAANVWVEPNGDVLILVAKNDAWDENSTLCKLGRVRLRCDPPLSPSAAFVQRLSLADASIYLLIDGVGFRLWSDANAPVVRIDVHAEREVAMTATLETWRNYPYIMSPTQTGDMFKNLTGKDLYRALITPDEVEAGRPGEVFAWHHNVERADDPVAINMKLQGLGEMLDQMPTPLTGRTFGMAMVCGADSQAANQRTIRLPAKPNHQIDLHALTSHPSTPEEWKQTLRRQIDSDHSDRAESFTRHAGWWKSYWERSRVLIQSATDSQNAFDVTRAYLLQRYMNACQGRGEFPIKHNGGLFTVGRPWDPDFRRWGGPGFWFMNQRLIYWPMLANGDFDLMRSWLEMYRKTLALQMHRTQKYFGHAGAHFPETMTFWGAEVSGHYGWQPFEERERPEAECAYLTYYWSGAIELILILIETIEYTGDATLATDFLRPIGEQVLLFYEHHYPRETNGTLRFEPAQSLETWHWAINPMPEVAGLQYTLDRLKHSKAGKLLPKLAEQGERLGKLVPPLPVGERDGQTVLLPAAEFDKKKNTENPELYCIFPYRLFGVGKPDMEMARRTFDRRLHVEHTCWHQDVIQMALLGMASEAKDFVSRRAAAECHSDSRFPAFWNAFHDWIPDLDHGGVLQLAIQCMLVQCDGQAIRLLPAWPKEWDADFKLHLPGPAVIEGRVRNGRIEHFEITPAERRGDVILPE